MSNPEQCHNVLSTLNFAGDDRANTNKLDHKDKGHFSCQFENQVGRSEHTTLLVIEHAPIQAHRHNKVAFNMGEQGQIYCRMRAYPEPRFDWTFGDDVLQLDVVNYSSNVTQLDQDLFESVLTVTRVRQTSYGEYTCRALNSMGALRTKIQLQRKGPPEVPSQLVPKEVGANMAVIEWIPGFDGGYKDTSFTVDYSWSDGRVETGQCGRLSSCNITALNQHTRYEVRVKAVNTAGESDWTESIIMETLVDLLNIPRPDSLVFELSTSMAHVRAPSSQLALVAELEVLDSVSGGWSKYGEQKLGEGETYGQMSVTIAQAYSQLPILEEGVPEEEVRRPSGIRARLCLEENSAACGPYIEGRTVKELDLAQPWLIALVVVVTLLGLIAVLIAIKCVCSTRRNGQGKVPGRGTKMLGRHGSVPHPGLESYKSAQVFAIAGENQHGGLPSTYDLQQQIEHGSNGSNSHTDSANSQVVFKDVLAMSSSYHLSPFRNPCGLTRKVPAKGNLMIITTLLLL